MRTYVYVDGFNLYYGLLKRTPHKWLDLKKLFSTVLGPSYDIQKIKYYTARITSRPGDLDGPTRQDTYLKAIKAFTPEVDIHEGHFLSKVVTMALAKPPTFGKKFTEVIRTDEKGSDVNLAIHLLNDAWLNRYDCAVIVSNDSDLAESMRLVKKYHHKKIVVLVPGDPAVRPPAVQLKKFSHKTISIPPTAVASSQLPDPIPGTSLHKPKEW